MGTTNIHGHSKIGNPVPVAADSSGALLTHDATLQVYVDAVDANNTYVGESVPGTAVTAATWRIKKIVVLGLLTTIKFADADDGFMKIWNSRASYTY